MYLLALAGQWTHVGSIIHSLALQEGKLCDSTTTQATTTAATMAEFQGRTNWCTQDTKFGSWGITSSIYLTCSSIEITNWIEWFESPHARGRATYWAEMGWLLQAATTNNLSGKREESTENWFLHSLHPYTQRICYAIDLCEKKYV